MGKYIETHGNFIQNYRNKLKKLKKRRKSNPSSKNDTQKTHEDRGVKRKKCGSFSEPRKKFRSYSCLKPTTSEKTIKANLSSGNVEVVENNLLKIKDDGPITDLFMFNEASNSWEGNFKTNFYFHIIDEIALEGLYGITLEALWKRLSYTFKSLQFDESVKDVIWKLICCNNVLEFYILPSPRDNLNIIERRKPDKEGTNEENYDLYPFVVVQQQSVQGCCSDFSTRENKTQEIRTKTLKEVKKYGNTLVVVADQKTRKNALIFDSCDPTFDLVDVEYCILERIGRARTLGEPTQGKNSLVQTMKDPKSLFHYKKELIQLSLISKQQCSIKEQNDQTKTGRLLHLRRFYNKTKTVNLVMVELIINYLKTKPNFRMEYKDLRILFPNSMKSVVKLVKSQEFREYVRTDVSVPYRTIYPNATISQWKCKALAKEKNIRVLELKNPHINILANWNKNEDDQSSDEEQVEEVQFGRKLMNEEFLRDLYNFILSHGEEGVLQSKIVEQLELEIYTTRAGLKKLMIKDLIFTMKINQGRQRYTVYKAKCFHESSKILPPITNPPPPPPRNESILARIKRKQKEALQSTPKERIYTENQALLEQIEPCDEIFPKLRNNYMTSKISCKFFEKKIDIEAMDVDLVDRNIAVFLKEGPTFHINLTFKQFVSLLKPGINSVIKSVRISNEFCTHSNYVDFYVDSVKYDSISKLLLLKLSFGEISLQNNTELVINCLEESLKTNKEFNTLLKERSIQVLNTSRADVVISTKKLKSDLNYMGLEPVVIHEEVTNDVKVKIVMSTVPTKYKTDNSVYQKPIVNSDITDKIISRIQFILDLVKKKKIIEDAHKVTRYIAEKEMQEGYDKRIDRKSLFRIYTKLIREGYIKIYKIYISNDTTEKYQSFLCDLDVPITHSVIKAFEDQVKLKFFMNIDKKITVVSQEKTKPPEKIPKEIKAKEKVDKDVRACRAIGKTYGYRPKFVRMQILHEFLYYLIYFYHGQQEALKKSDVVELFQIFKINLTEQDLEELPPIYCKEISWKTFINPLPLQKGWDQGWALVADLILRLPLSIFIKIYSVNYLDHDLLKILQHPVKRHYPVITLSQKIKNLLLSKRKYLASIHEMIKYLAFIGLIQFGPVKGKEKDQVYIYLNKRASLYDTTSSEPSYNKVTVKDYEKLEFEFTNQLDLQNYWYKLWMISMTTKLGHRSVMMGKSITLFDISIKPELLKSTEAQTNESAFQNDVGELPGDRRGAAGVDSNLWVHITKNWLWVTRAKKPDAGVITVLKKEKFDDILSSPIPYSNLKSAYHNIPKIYLHQKKIPVKSAQVTPVMYPMHTTKANPKVTRKFALRKAKKARRTADPVDKSIQKMVGKNRAAWDKTEDKLLFISIAALYILGPNYPKKSCVPHTVPRDVLHLCYPKSRNKSSSVMRRRMRILTIRKNSYKSLEVNFTNLYKIPDVRKYFFQFRTTWNEPGKKIKETEASVAYVYLMSYLLKNINTVEVFLTGQAINIDYFSPENINDYEESFVGISEDSGSYIEPLCEEDVKKEAVKNIIHSNLSDKDDVSSRSYQLFKTYQKYPDMLIRDAVADLQRQQIISLKHSGSHITKKSKVTWNTPFQLSNFYVYMLACTFNVTSALECYEVYLHLSKRVRGVLDFSIPVVEKKKYGQMIGFNEACSFWSSVHFVFNIPKSAVILNPNIEDHTELINELAHRYQIKRKRLAENIQKDEENLQQAYSKISQTPEEAINNSIKPSKVPEPEPEDLDAPLEEIENLETVESLERIDKLKTWISDCVNTDLTRRSPSPEFLMFDEEIEKESEKENVTENDSAMEVKKQLTTSDVNEDIMEMNSISEIPSLDEIKIGMMVEDGNIPYITDLSTLLTREAYPERDLDEDTMERLKSHFTSQYPQIVDIYLEDEANDEAAFEECYLFKFITDEDKKRKLFSKIESSSVKYCQLNLEDLKPAFRELGGTEEDWSLALAILEFIFSKNYMGATGTDIKDNSDLKPHNLELQTVVEFLVEHKAILMAGVNKKRFIHYQHQKDWLVDAFLLSPEEQYLIKDITDIKVVNEVIEKRTRTSNDQRVHLFPWSKLDGSMNKPQFLKWLICVLSHIVDNPTADFTNIFDKYSYVKPVDLYYLLRILKELGCIDIYVCDKEHFDLFDNCTELRTRKASILDELDEMYPQPNNISMTCLGSFFKTIENV